MDNNKLFIGSLPWSINNDSLRDLFAQYGETLTQLSSWTEIQEDQKVSDSLLSSQDSAEKHLKWMEKKSKVARSS